MIISTWDNKQYFENLELKSFENFEFSKNMNNFKRENKIKDVIQDLVFGYYSDIQVNLRYYSDLKDNFYMGQ